MSKQIFDNSIVLNWKVGIWQRDSFKYDLQVEHSMKFEPDPVDPDQVGCKWNNSIWLVGSRFKTYYPLVSPGPVGGVPSMAGVFLRDPSPYLREFRRKPRKTPNG